MARQRGEDMLKRIAVALPSAASFPPFDALAVMKESHEVRRSQEGKREEEEEDKEELKSKEEDEEMLVEKDKEVSVERWNAVAISV